MKAVSRRSFVASGLAAGAGAGLLAQARRLGWAETLDTLSPLASPGYDEVSLLEGPLQAQFRQNLAFFLALDDDRLLKPYRQRAHMPAPGEEMGGWYSNNFAYDYQTNNQTGFCPGHSLGQWVSALSRMYAATGDTRAQAKVERLIQGYAATIGDSFYEDNRFSAYIYDKLVCGLIDAHAFAKSPAAFDVLERTTDTALRHLPPRALSRKEQCDLPHKNVSYCWDESYTLPENLFLAYTRGAGARYRELGARYLEDRDYFDPLAENENVLAELHAYSHVNALSSAMQAYLVMGSEKHLRAASNAFTMIVNGQSYATGGWGPREAFWTPGTGALGRSLVDTHSSFETPCGSYAHMKLTRYLLRVTRDSRYGDSMERVIYNTVMGARPVAEDGSSFYYSDYNNAGAKKSYSPDKWPCCSGTLPQVAADYGISAYLRSPRAVYVNLYIPSRLRWMQRTTRVELTQQTEYPFADHTSMTLSMSTRERFALLLRVPAWAGPKTRVLVNGKHWNGAAEPGTFAFLHREWKHGDRVEVEFDIAPRLEAVDDLHPNQVALVRGPLALMQVAPRSAARLTRTNLLAAKGSGDDWQVRAESGETLRMRPFSSIADESYRLYQDVAA